MAGFSFAKNQNGGTPTRQPLLIVYNTAIEKGEIVGFTPGTGVVAVTAANYAGPAIGVADEAHDGSTAGRQVGTEIFVITNPDAIFALNSTNIITATSGSTTTFVVSGLLPQTNNLWTGGMLYIIACAADSTLNGKMIPITGSTGSSGTLTVATQTGVFASGDTAYLCPGPAAITEHAWDLASDGDDVDWDSDGAFGLQLVGSAPKKMISYWSLRGHYFGNSVIALVA